VSPSQLVVGWWLVVILGVLILGFTLAAFYTVTRRILRLCNSLDASTWYKELEELRRRLADTVSQDQLNSIKELVRVIEEYLHSSIHRISGAVAPLPATIEGQSLRLAKGQEKLGQGQEKLEERVGSVYLSLAEIFRKEVEEVRKRSEDLHNNLVDTFRAEVADVRNYAVARTDKVVEVLEEIRNELRHQGLRLKDTDSHG